MGLLSELEKAEAEELVEQAVVLPADDFGNPAWVVELRYADRDQWRDFLESYNRRRRRRERGQGGFRFRQDEDEILEQDLIEMRRKIFDKAVKGWTGLTRENLMRLSSFALARREAVLKTCPELIPYDPATARELAQIIEETYMAEIIDAISRFADFYAARREREKKDSVPTSASA